MENNIIDFELAKNVNDFRDFYKIANESSRRLTDNIYEAIEEEMKLIKRDESTRLYVIKIAIINLLLTWTIQCKSAKEKGDITEKCYNGLINFFLEECRDVPWAKKYVEDFKNDNQ